MKHILKNIGFAIASCLFISALYSCNGNETASGTKCADSTANTTTTATTTTATNNTTSAGGNVANAAGTGASANAGKENGARESDRMKAGAAGKPTEQSMEPTGPALLSVSSPAFGTGNVIPVKYTCDGQGATPPINVTNIPDGTKSLTLIVHDYEATPEGGFTYWLIWNLDASGNIPENFVNNHEGMNAAKQYGYTPICAKSGNHKYHFIVYALDTRLVMPKTTTKQGLESVMKDHILGKGEVVGVYNKHLE
jgi:Raf kinase inhibitor-like YbhB/YbcL family protein